MNRVRPSYNEYIETVVKQCSHKWLIMDNKKFREYRLFKYTGDANAIMPPGKMIKIIPARCKSYSCPICGKKKVYDLIDRLRGVNYKGFRFFTLTMKSTGNLDNTEHNLKRIIDCFNRLNKQLRKDQNFKDLKFFRVVEIGNKTGMVHIHGIWNKYIPVVKLSNMWKSITKDSYRVDLQRIESKKDVVNYLYKYLTKNAAGTLTETPGFWNMDKKNTAAIFYENKKRRYSASRNFFAGAVKVTSDFIPFYVEKHTPKEIDHVISQLIREFGLKKDQFDFTFYDHCVFTDYLFNTS